VTDEAKPDATPATFSELLGASGVKACGRCGEPSTHSMRLTVSTPRPRSGQRGGQQADSVASHSGRLCEKCAVQVFATFRKAIR
jgi:hypothetical protein